MSVPKIKPGGLVFLMAMVVTIILVLLGGTSGKSPQEVALQASPVPTAQPTVPGPVETGTALSSTQTPDVTPTAYPTRPPVNVTIVPMATGTPPTWTPPFETPDPTAVAEISYMQYVYYDQPGTVIAQRVFTTPIVPPLPFSSVFISSYRLEEVIMSRPATVLLTIAGARPGEYEQVSRTIDKIWRFSVTGGGFHVRNSGWSIWIGDKKIVMREWNGRSLTGIVYDRAELVEGAPMGIGMASSGPPTYVPITLHLDTPPSP